MILLKTCVDLWVLPVVILFIMLIGCQWVFRCLSPPDTLVLADNPFSSHLEQPNKSDQLLDCRLFYGNILQNALQGVNQFKMSNNAPKSV